MSVAVRAESPAQAEVLALIDELDAWQEPMYPAESHHGVDIAALQRPNVVFAVARDDGIAVGCGAIVMEAGWAELKRMYVRPALRGRGIAQSLLGFLEAQALLRGITVVRLETGFRHDEGLRFYERAGYARRGPFGEYVLDPNSVFMEKRLQETRSP